jgi:Na+-translocating ferredoxin:NAD+ oxidoreductase subunit C
MEKRAAEKAAVDAMSPEEKAAKEAEKQAKIAAALAKAAEKKAAAAQAVGLPLDQPRITVANSGKAIAG